MTECMQPGCGGEVVDGVCTKCGEPARKSPTVELVLSEIRALLSPQEVAPSREDLAKAAEGLKTVFPYNYEAWRLHADLIIKALHQLETRQLQTDAGFTIMAIPLREDDLRDAAEIALRQCAHFADSHEKMVAAIDEANRVRKLTWL